MLSRLARSLRSSRPYLSASVPSQDHRRRSAADSALVSRHGQDLLVGLRRHA
jgi:hypothetical protein